jgi:hypothetical protein
MGFKVSREAKQSLRKGWHLDKDQDGNVLFLEGAEGVPKGSYYNPSTGQQFSSLPTDPWSLELYIKKHKLRVGQAPPELQKKWLAELKKQKKIGVSNKPVAHGLPINPSHVSVKALEDKVANLTKQVEALLKLATAQARIPSQESNGAPVVE